MKIILKIVLPLLIVVTFVFLPFFSNPNILLERGNDLTEFFWPSFYYIKNSIYNYHQVPLWNNLYFQGTPLLPDPQNPTWYLPNIIFLFMSIDTAIIVSLFIHTLLAGVGIYLLANQLRLRRNTSFLISALYVSSPILASYFEAGHWGLIITYSLIPYLALSTIKTVKTKRKVWAILLAFILQGIYINHFPTFFICLFSILIYWLTVLLKNKKEFFKYTHLYLLTFLTFIVISTVFLLPQLEWIPQTSRNLLLTFPDTYPKWGSKIEFIKYVFIPWLLSSEEIQTEKLITLGITVPILATIGFLGIKRSYKAIILLSIFAITLVSLNNLSLIYNFLLSFKIFVLLRVATRVWIINLFIIVFLAGLGYEFVAKRNKHLAQVFVLISILEWMFIGYSIINKPISPTQKAPKEVYEFLSKDREIFRVFCTTRCLSQKESAIHELKLAEGYGTVFQKNYFDASMQIGQYFWDKYSLSIPPFEIISYQELQPHAPTLANYSIKYVISPHYLVDTNLLLIDNFGKYKIYRNSLYKKLNYSYYSPNRISLLITSDTQELVLPEIYSSGWNAYLNGKTKTKTIETHDKLLAVDTTSHPRSIDFKYLPDSFLLGLFVTGISYLLLLTLGVFNLFQKLKSRRIKVSR